MKVKMNIDEVIKLKEYFVLNGVKYFKNDLEMLEDLKSSFEFIVDSSVLENLRYSDYKHNCNIAELGDIDLPFRGVFISFMNNIYSEVPTENREFILEFIKSKKEFINEQIDFILSRQLGVNIVEKSPKNYSQLVIQEVYIKLKSGNESKFKIIGSCYNDSSINIFVKDLFNRLNSREIDSANLMLDRKIKIKSDNKKVIKIIDNPIILYKKKYGVSDLFNSYNIDYSHRFFVRGHWREFNGIGKNRDGIRDVKGFTWVVPYVKGDEHLPIINKARVFSNEFSGVNL